MLESYLRRAELTWSSCVPHSKTKAMRQELAQGQDQLAKLRAEVSETEASQPADLTVAAKSFLIVLEGGSFPATVVDRMQEIHVLLGVLDEGKLLAEAEARREPQAETENDRHGRCREEPRRRVTTLPAPPVDSRHEAGRVARNELRDLRVQGLRAGEPWDDGEATGEKN